MVANTTKAWWHLLPNGEELGNGRFPQPFLTTLEARLPRLACHLSHCRGKDRHRLPIIRDESSSRQSVREAAIVWHLMFHLIHDDDQQTKLQNHLPMLRPAQG